MIKALEIRLKKLSFKSFFLLFGSLVTVPHSFFTTISLIVTTYPYYKLIFLKYRLIF